MFYFLKLSKVLLLLTLISTLTLLLTSCEEPTSSGGGSGNSSVTLTVADASCTEAWLRVTAQGVNFNNGAELTLLRDDTARSSFSIYSADTVIYDEGLLPSKTYRYMAKLTFTPTQTNGSVTKESAEAEAVTMDTTSHDFTWQTFTFGGANGSSYLRDVAIINENDIWAVGEIHTSWTDQYDSNGVWVQPYNAVHWDGQEWELRRIFINNTFYPIRNVMAFAENNIVFSNISVIFWTGSDENITFTSPPRESTDSWRINSMWGISNEDFYVVGNGGNIAHYQNGSWTKIESGTGLDFYDIWGDLEQKILSSSRLLVYLNKTGSLSYENFADTNYLTSVWKNYKTMYICGGGVFKRTDRGIWIMQENIPYYFTYKIRGLKKNEIFVIGVYGLIAHYNGINWKSFITETDIRYYSIDLSENLIIAVGAKGYGFNDKAVITVSNINK
jgi:hypothetical protein